MSNISLKRLGIQKSSKKDGKTKKKALLQRTSDDVQTTLMSEAISRNGKIVLDWATIPPKSEVVFREMGGPRYLNPLSFISPSNAYLTIEDCHRALVASIYSACLILFELKRQVSGPRNGRLVLDGSPRLLNEELVQEVNKLGPTLYAPQPASGLLRNLWSAYLEWDSSFAMESGQSYMSLVAMGTIGADMIDR